MLATKNSRGQYTGTINIDKLGALAGADSVDGVFVVFYGPKPESNENLVVGWYDQAIVYRSWRQGGDENNYRNNGQYNEYYSFEVMEPSHCSLIPSGERDLGVVSAVHAKRVGIKGSYSGQASIFFDSSNEEYVASVVSQLRGKKSPLAV